MLAAAGTVSWEGGTRVAALVRTASAATCLGSMHDCAVKMSYVCSGQWWLLAAPAAGQEARGATARGRLVVSILLCVPISSARAGLQDLVCSKSAQQINWKN